MQRSAPILDGRLLGKTLGERLKEMLEHHPGIATGYEYVITDEVLTLLHDEDVLDTLELLGGAPAKAAFVTLIEA